MGTLHLKPTREKSLLRRHPWVFSGALAKVVGNPDAGATVAVRAADGRFLAHAAYSPASQIVARVWSWDEAESIDATFFRNRLEDALAARRGFFPWFPDSALRLVNAESDGLPGIIIDRYGDLLVAQLLTAGADAWRHVVFDELMALTKSSAIFERSDAEVRELEGLPVRTGMARGAYPTTTVAIVEHGLRYQVDVATGHKTGFYLDQRDSRARIGALASNRTVLDCFCYSGGFTVNALAGGACSVTAVDASADALALARVNLDLNRLPVDRVEWVRGDVFKELRRLRDAGRAFDLIVLDPPKFAPTAAQADKAARGYKDINWLAFRLLAPGGILATFSCSGGVGADLFRKIVAGAALDAGVNAQVIGHLHPPSDHPVTLAFPEGEYLKGLLCRVG
ncbi:MAG: class I SAM-dependent methyltransferase [Gammaproteobacteria bacterium]